MSQQLRRMLPMMVVWGFLTLGAGGVQAQGVVFEVPLNNAPSPTQFLYDRAVAGTGSSGGGGANFPSGPDPNAYWNTARDPGYFDRYDAATRSSIERSYRPPQFNSSPPRPAAPMKPVVELKNFFRSGSFVWPRDASSAGDLKALRDAAEQAIAAAEKERYQNGTASLTGVADARKKLIAYGQPALQAVRGYGSVYVSELFHSFLMSLYDGLGQATVKPKAPEPSRLSPGSGS